MYRKLFTWLLVCICLFSCACAEPVGMGNPRKEYTSLEEINRIVDCQLCHPAVMGVTNEVYAIIDCGDYRIAEYSYRVNGLDYCFCASGNIENDISGYFTENGTLFEKPQENKVDYATTEDVKAARWHNISGQYLLSVKDNGEMDDETFAAIINETMALTCPVITEEEMESYYSFLAGFYQDRVSQRATAEVIANGSKNAVIEVFWADSASSETAWTMTLELSEDGLLYYRDCKCVTRIYDEEGNMEESTVFENGKGSFVFDVKEDILYWNEAEDETCSNCEFEKIPE